MKFFKLSGFALVLLAVLQINSPIQAESVSSEAQSEEDQLVEEQSIDDQSEEGEFANDQSTDDPSVDVQSAEEDIAPQSYQTYQSNNYYRSRQTLTFKLTRTLGEGCQTLIDNFTAEVSKTSNSRTLKTAAGTVNFRSIPNEWNNPNRYVTNVYRYDELNDSSADLRLGQSYAWATNEINGCINDSVLRQRIFSRGELLCDYTWETWENSNNSGYSSCQNYYSGSRHSRYYRRRHY